MQKSNFSAEDFVSKLNAEIDRQGIENLGVVLDNTGSVVISNSDTEDEFVISSPDSASDIEDFIKFVVSNGLEINKSNIENFAFDKLKADIEAKRGKVKVGAGLNNVGDKYNAYKIVSPLLSNLESNYNDLEQTLKEGSLKAADKKLNDDVYKVFKFYENLKTNLDKIAQSQFEDSKFEEFKQMEDTLLSHSKDHSKKAEEDVNKKEAEQNNDSLEKVNSDFKKLKQKCSDKPSFKDTDECRQALESLKERKAKLLNASEVVHKNFDERSDAVKNVKSSIAHILNQQLVGLKSVDMTISSTKFDSHKWKKFKDKLSSYVKKITSTIEGISKRYNLPTEEDIEKQAKQLAQEREERLAKLAKDFEEFNTSENILSELYPNIKWSDTVIAATEQYQANESDENKKALFKALKDMTSAMSDEKAKEIISKISKSSTATSSKDDPLADDNTNTESQKQEQEQEQTTQESTDNNSDLDSKLDKAYDKYVNQMKNKNKTPMKKENWKKMMGFSEYTTFSSILDKITSKKVISFDAHQVKDSELGIVWEDKYGSLWSDNPDETPDADLLFESSDGKEEPTNEPKVEDENESETDDLGGEDIEEGEEGGDEDMDLDLESEDDMDLDPDSDEDDLSLDDDSDSDVGDDLDFSEEEDDNDDDDFDLSLDDDEEDEDLDFDLDEGDADTELEENDDDVSDGENLSKALDVIKSMYNTLAEKIK